MKTSEKIDLVIAALIKAKQEFKPLKKTAENPFYKSKYSTLSDVIESTDEALAKNGLTIAQVSRMENGVMLLETILAHTSGQYIAGEYPVVSKDPQDAQKIGASCSYARRYALQAILGCTAEDDDAQTAVQPAQNVGYTSHKGPVSVPTPSTGAIGDYIVTAGNSDIKGKKLSDCDPNRLNSFLAWASTQSNPGGNLKHNMSTIKEYLATQTIQTTFNEQDVPF